MSDRLLERVIETVRRLSEDRQQRVLEFAESLTASVPQGVAGRQLLQFANTISVEDLQTMQAAIESGCEI